MTHSEQIHELAAALALAQAELGNAEKDAKNPHFRSSYSTLASVRDAVKPMHKHGLSVVQTARAEGANVTVDTLLLHKSGQWIADALTMQARDAGPQSIGSAITYGRRYALAAIVGIAPEDDDAEEATDRSPRTVVDTATGEDKPISELPPAPPGYHYVTDYQVRNGWHEAKVLRWDAQGGALKVCTKFEQKGGVLGEASRTGVPARIDVQPKKGTKGEAYLNDIHLWKPTHADDNAEIDAEIARREMATAASEVA